MIENTTILRSLTADEISSLKQELPLIDHLWENHHTPTDLQDGKTVYLNQCSDSLEFVKARFDLLPKTKKIIDSVIAPHYAGRCYWHRLMPGDGIMPHTDASLGFIKEDKLEHRYQIYLDSSDDIKLMLDGKLDQGSKYSNCLVDFNLLKPHAYKNTSTEPWYILVFDALNVPLSLS